MVYNEYSRREFIKTVALGSMALSIGCSKTPVKPKVGLQLYTLRSVIFDDFPGAIKKIADMGYIGVETWGGLTEKIDLKQAAKTIKEAGLVISSCHCELPTGNNREVALKMAEAYGTDRLIYHGWPAEGKFGTQEELNKTVETYDAISDDFKAQGLKFGLHNHWFEFEKAASGVIPFYYLLENVSKDIFFEIDTYWASVGGYDPAKAVKDFGPRAPFLHIKDGTARKGEKENIHVPAGQGAMDFPAIAKAGGENIKWMIVEFDNFEIDIFDGIKQSYDYLTKNGLALGRI